MEQLVARRAHNPKVVSSSLAPATTIKRPLNRGLFLYLKYRDFSFFKIIILVHVSYDFKTYLKLKRYVIISSNTTGLCINSPTETTYK